MVARSKLHEPEFKRPDLRRSDLSKDGSDSTLVSVDGNFKDIGHLPSKNWPKRGLQNQRKVSFCETLVVASYRDKRTKNQCILTWYEPEDYEGFAADARKYIRRITEQEAQAVEDGGARSVTFSQAVHEIFQTACRVPVVDNTTNGCFLTPAEIKRFRRTYKALGGSKLIGLEYYAVQSLREMAKDQREKLQFTVDVIQPYYIPDSIEEQEDMAFELKSRCAELTSTSCAMAQFLAQVHANL